MVGMILRERRKQVCLMCMDVAGDYMEEKKKKFDDLDEYINYGDFVE